MGYIFINKTNINILSPPFKKYKPDNSCSYPQSIKIANKINNFRKIHIIF